jgi:capsular polysaccharide transport system permease protein
MQIEPKMTNLQTTPISPSTKEIEIPQKKEGLLLSATKWLFGKGKLFLWIVLFPTFISILYFGPIASDVYISESKFVVRSPQAQPQGGIGGILSSIGVANSGQDGYVVAGYIESMDAMMSVNKSINLRTLFTSPSIDIFNRFASFFRSDSYEKLLTYFNDRVTLNYDPVSSVAILSVRAYTNKSAYEINRLLLESSEQLVNRLSDQARQDLIQFASYEIDIARKNLEQADAALIQFRNKKDVASTNFVAQFQQLNLQRDTAEKQLGSAIAALEQARVDAQRKRLYIERVVQPNLPDYPLEPKRIFGILATLIVCLVIWGIVKMVVAGVKEHHG